MTQRHETLTAEEADALYEAAGYVLTRDWGSNEAEETALRRAVRKLRRADVLTILPEQEG